MFSIICLLITNGVLATIPLSDPGDILPASLYATDNAIVPDYNVPFISVQPSPLLGSYIFEGNVTALDHAEFSATGNDTSVIVAADGAELTLSYVEIVKSGYASNLLLSSFYGFNAAVNIANASTAHFDHINVTVHNGAANIYAYGTNTTVYVDNAWLYSSGPVSHGVYASGNATTYLSHITQFSGGKRSSSFSGDNPAGYLYISDSTAHAMGIGSATFYALGSIYADNVVATSDNGPTLFMDGPQIAELTNCETTAGLLGGVVIFSSRDRLSGAVLKIANSKMTSTGPTMPGLWFGNTIIDVWITASEIITASGILVVANYSQITQDFDYYGSYLDNPHLLPAEVFVNVAESSLTGDIVPYNGSYISWSLASHSAWTGTAYAGYGDGFVDVYLDHTSTWTLTKTTEVQNFTDEDTTLQNVNSAGFDLVYNSSAVLNGWLQGATIALKGGGSAKPM